MVDNNGIVRTYNASDNNLEQINGAKFIFTLYDKTLKIKYFKAIEAFRAQLKTQPRAGEGGFWHDAAYPNQMWLDDIYMASPFLAEYAKRFNEKETLDDVIKQIALITKHTCDPKTGLYYHAWNESKTEDWANKTTGCSPTFFSRGMRPLASACATQATSTDASPTLLRGYLKTELRHWKVELPDLPWLRALLR